MLSFPCAFSSHSSSIDGPDSAWQVAGFVASSQVVLVVEQGDCWVKRSEDDIEAYDAPHVFVWAPGDWVEYGSLRGMTERSYFGPREQSAGWHPADDGAT